MKSVLKMIELNKLLTALLLFISSIIRMRAKSAMPQKMTNIEAELEQQNQKSKILD